MFFESSMVTADLLLEEPGVGAAIALRVRVSSAPKNIRGVTPGLFLYIGATPGLVSAGGHDNPGGTTPAPNTPQVGWTLCADSYCDAVLRHSLALPPVPTEENHGGKMIEKQISNQYLQALNSFTKKEILDQIEKNNSLDLPQNLIDQELLSITKNLKQEDKDKNKQSNEKIAKSRIKLGLILNEIGEKNNLKVSDEEVKAEIQKQIKGMPGQEKFVLEYYQKNPSASQSLKGSLYEEKIIEYIKSKITLKSKEIDTKEAEKLISDFNRPNSEKTQISKPSSQLKNKIKSKKISKK